MALTVCAECSNQVSEQAAICPHCGAPQLKSEKSDWSPVINVGLGLIFVLIVGGLFSGQNKTPRVGNAAGGYSVNDAVSSMDKPTQWEYSTGIDPVSNSEWDMACVESEDMAYLEWPYKPVTMTLCLRRSKQNGTNVRIALNGKGQILCMLEACSFRARFDDKVRSFAGVGPADYSSTSIFARNGAAMASAIKSAKKTIIEITFYEAGTQPITFNTEGLQWK